MLPLYRIYKIIFKLQFEYGRIRPPERVVKQPELFDATREQDDTSHQQGGMCS